MTFEEFLEKCRKKDGWRLYGMRLRNESFRCPLQAVFNTDFYDDYYTAAQEADLNPTAIIRAADGETNGSYRKALLTLVQP